MSDKYQPYRDYAVGDKVRITSGRIVDTISRAYVFEDDKTATWFDKDKELILKGFKKPPRLKRVHVDENLNQIPQKLVARYRRPFFITWHESNQAIYVGYAVRHLGEVVYCEYNYGYEYNNEIEKGGYLKERRVIFLARLRFCENGEEHLTFFDEIQKVADTVEEVQ